MNQGHGRAMTELDGGAKMMARVKRSGMEDGNLVLIAQPARGE